MLTNDKNGDRLTLRTVMDEPCLLYEDARRIVSRAAGAGAEPEAVRTAMRKLDDLMEGYWCGVGELESCKDIVDVVSPFIPLAERPAEPASGTGAQAKVEAMFESGSLFKEIENNATNEYHGKESAVYWGAHESGVAHLRLYGRHRPERLIFDTEEIKDRIEIEHGLSRLDAAFGSIFDLYFKLALKKTTQEGKSIILCVQDDIDRCVEWIRFLHGISDGKYDGIVIPAVLSLSHQLLRAAEKRLAAAAWGLPELDRPSLTDNIASFERIKMIMRQVSLDKNHPYGNDFSMKRGYSEFTRRYKDFDSVWDSWNKTVTPTGDERGEIAEHAAKLTRQAADMYRQGFLTEERFSEIADVLRYVDEHEVRLPKDALERLDETKCPVIPGSRRGTAMYENRFAERKLEFDAEPLVVEEDMFDEEIKRSFDVPFRERNVFQSQVHDAFRYYYRGGSKEVAFDRIYAVLEQLKAREREVLEEQGAGITELMP